MKIGLALGGGGAKGAYQIGVLKALEEYNLTSLINVYSGVSIGALNAYFYLSSNSVLKLEEAWLYGISKNPLKEEGFFHKTNEAYGFYNMDIIREMASKFTDEKLFKESNKDLHIILTKVSEPSILDLIKKTTKEKVVIHLNKKDNPLDYVISSASVPVVFGFQKIEDNYYVDGGIMDNNAIDVLISKGAKVIFHSSFEKNIDLLKYNNEDLTLIELTSMKALPPSRLYRFLLSADFNLDSFHRRVKFGYYVTVNMIKYLITENILTVKDDLLMFNEDIKGFNNIRIPEEIHEEVKRMYIEK